MNSNRSINRIDFDGLKNASKKILIWIIFGSLLLANIWFAFGGTSLTDFGSFFASGKNADLGLNPYTDDHPLIFHLSNPELNIEVDMLNLNPPISVIFFQALSDLEPFIAYRLWQIITIALYIIAIVLFYRSFPQYRSTTRILWVLSLAGFWQTVRLGQVYTLLLLFAVIAWIFLSTKRYILAGIFIGFLVAIKPNFAVWILFILISAPWATALASITTVGLMSIVPVFAYGPNIYWQWFDAISKFPGIVFPRNNSLAGFSSYIGFPQLGMILSVLLILVTSIWIWKRKISPVQASGLAVIVSLLASPIAWTAYMIILLPVMLERKWNWMLNIAAINLIIPIWVIAMISLSSKANYIIFGWAYGWSLILILIALITEQSSMGDGKQFGRQTVCSENY